MLYYKYKKEKGTRVSQAHSTKLITNIKGGIIKMYIDLKPITQEQEQEGEESEESKESHSSLYESFKETTGTEFRYLPDLPVEYIRQMYEEMAERVSPIPIEFPVRNGVLYMKSSTMPITNERYIGAGYKTEYLTFPCIAPMKMPRTFYSFLETVFQCGEDYKFMRMNGDKLETMDLLD